MELKKARGLEAYFLIPSTTKGLKWGYLWVSLGTPPPKVWNLLVSGSLSNTIKIENLLSENKKRRNINIKYFFEISTYQPGHPNIFPWCCHEKKRQAAIFQFQMVAPPASPSPCRRPARRPRPMAGAGRRHRRIRRLKSPAKVLPVLHRRSMWNAEKCWKGCCEKTFCSFFYCKCDSDVNFFGYILL